MTKLGGEQGRPHRQPLPAMPPLSTAVGRRLRRLDADPRTGGAGRGRRPAAVRRGPRHGDPDVQASGSTPPSTGSLMLGAVTARTSRATRTSSRHLLPDLVRRPCGAHRWQEASGRDFWKS
ncbi:MAG: hypothetical protein MZV64_34800 [Ignavibacteriales bacterium]|nr:hypothetical protein [Ignavibacteriales bacterium]